jgi:hypothetical protein
LDQRKSLLQRKQGGRPVAPINPASQFLRTFLKERNLVASKKDKPLFTYQMTQEEYDQLKLLVQTLQRHQLTDDVTCCSAGAFVLFAAEWYRREYDGSSGWSWQGLEQILGYGLDHLDCKKIVIDGLQKYWQRSVKNFETNHKSWLG